MTQLRASAVVVFDTRTQQVVEAIPNVASVHGVLAVPERGKVYATATGKYQVPVIDAPKRLAFIAGAASQAAGDGYWYDAGDRGGGGVVPISGESELDGHKLGEGLRAPHAHAVALDSRTHCVYVPFEDIGGKPVLWIMQPLLPEASNAACG